jgi:phage terminase small subunit
MTNKQRAFIEEYLIDWDATRAVIDAGYKVKNRQRASEIGYQLLQNTPVKEEIQRRLAIKVMTADEALDRLSQQARGDIGDFAGVVRTPQDAGSHPQSHLIHKLKTRGRKNKDGTVTVTTEIELYNSQTALQLIGKHYGLFVDRHAQTNLNIDLSTLTDKQLERIRNGEDPAIVATTG